MGQVVTIYIDDGRIVDMRQEKWEPDDEPAPVPTTKGEQYERRWLAWLLDRCKIDDVDSVMAKYAAEQIVLVCCRALWLAKHDRLRAGSPKPFVLAMLMRGCEVKDHRDEIFGDLRSHAAVSRRSTSEVAAEVVGAAVDEEEGRRAAYAVLQEHLGKIGRF